MRRLPEDAQARTRRSRDRFPIGYYREDELPILGALAKGYTTFDNYFCSMMGPTWENRLYQLTGTTQPSTTATFREKVSLAPSQSRLAIFDRVLDARLTAAYYYHGEPMTGLFAERAVRRHLLPDRRNSGRTLADGKLANVVFIDPDYSDLAEDIGHLERLSPMGQRPGRATGSSPRSTMR